MAKLNSCVLLILLTVSLSSFAQVKSSEIFGSWIITSISFKDGSALPDENPLKYTFVKYTFDEANKMYSSTKSANRGGLTYYQIKKDQLIINNISGVIISNFLISKKGPDTLKILRKGPKGFGDPDAIQYTFVRENLVQQAQAKSNANNYTISGKDTVYNQSPTLYAKFYQPAGIEEYVTTEMKDKAGEQGTGLFRMSFVVDKNGIADSIKVIRGIWQGFDDLYIKAFKKAKSKWKPAMLNGKPVAVKMFAEAKFAAMAMIRPSLTYGSQADALFNNGKYEEAMQYYDAALKNYADNEENTYKRAVCKLRLNDIAGGLADLKLVKEMQGNLQVDSLIAEYSK
jgi:tetratricopeptide (TPR) repeat protein